MNIIYPVKQIFRLLVSDDFEMESKWEGIPLSHLVPKISHWEMKLELEMELEFKMGFMKWNKIQEWKWIWTTDERDVTVDELI